MLIPIACVFCGAGYAGSRTTCATMETVETVEAVASYRVETKCVVAALVPTHLDESLLQD